MKCILCGCTEAHACDDGCSWLTVVPPICTTHIQELVVDALRWRAFISSDRFRLLGTGGKGPTMHMGLELWGMYRLPASSRVSHGAATKLTADARKLLTKYADDRRKEGYR